MAQENNENLTVLKISDIRTMKKDIAWLQAGGRALLEKKKKEAEEKARKFLEKQIYEEEEKEIVAEIRRRAEQEKLRKEAEEFKRIEEERRKIEESRRKAEEERIKIEKELKMKEEEERLLQEERKKIEEIRKKMLQKLEQEKQERQRIRMSEIQKREMERLMRQKEEEERRMMELKAEKWAMEEKRQRILQEIKQREEEERKRLEEIKRKTQESFRRKQEELERKRREKEEKMMVAESLQKISEEKKAIELKRSALLKKVWPIDKTIAVLLRKEANIAEKLKEIEEREMATTSEKEKREIEKERWVFEDKRRQAEKNLLPWLKDKEKFQAQIEEIEREYADVLAREELLKEKQKEIFAKEERVRLTKKRAELENLLLEIGQEKESEILERDKVYQDLLEIEDKLKIIVEKERKIEEDKFLLEEREGQMSEAERISLKQQRWELEERRRQVEKERWHLEDEKKQVELKIKDIEDKLQRTEEREIEIKENINEIDIKLSGSLEEPAKKTEEVFLKEVSSFSGPVFEDIQTEKESLKAEFLKKEAAKVVKEEPKPEEQKKTEENIQPTNQKPEEQKKTEENIQPTNQKPEEIKKEEQKISEKENIELETVLEKKEPVVENTSQPKPQEDGLTTKERIEEAKRRIEFLREELQKQRLKEIEATGLNSGNAQNLNSFSIKDATDKSNLLFPNEIKDNQYAFKEESKDDFNKALEDIKNIKKEQRELQRQVFKDVKKEDQAPTFPSLSEIPQPPFPREKPSLFQKTGMRIAVLFVFLVITSGIIFFFYWFFKIRPEPLPPPPLSDNQPSTTTTENLDNATTTVLPDNNDDLPDNDKKISIPESLIETERDLSIEISKPEEIPGLFSFLKDDSLKEKLPSNEFIRIILKNKEDKEIVSLRDFLNSLRVNTPQGFLEKVEPEFTLFVYSRDGENNQLGIIMKEKEDISQMVSKWEKTMDKDLNNLSSLLGDTKKTANASFKTNKYKGISFRCLDFSQKNFGICHTKIDNLFLLTWSGEILIKAIDKLTQ